MRRNQYYSSDEEASGSTGSDAEHATYTEHSGSEYEDEAYSNDDDDDVPTDGPSIAIRGGMLVDQHGKDTKFHVHDSDNGRADTAAMMSEVTHTRGAAIKEKIQVIPVLNLLRDARVTLKDFGLAGEVQQNVMDQALAMAQSKANGRSTLYCAVLPNFGMPANVDTPWPQGTSMAFQVPANSSLRSPIPWTCLPQKDLLRGVLAVRIPPPREAEDTTNLYRAVLGAKMGDLRWMRSGGNTPPNIAQDVARAAGLAFDWAYVQLAAEVRPNAEVVLWLVLRDGFEELSTHMYVHIQAHYAEGWGILHRDDYHISGKPMDTMSTQDADSLLPFPTPWLTDEDTRSMPLNMTSCRELLAGKLRAQAQRVLEAMGLQPEVAHAATTSVNGGVFTMTHGFHSALNERVYIIYAAEAECVVSQTSVVLSTPPGATYILHGRDMASYRDRRAPVRSVGSAVHSSYSEWSGTRSPWLFMYPTSTPPLPEDARIYTDPPLSNALCYAWNAATQALQPVGADAVPGVSLPRNSTFLVMEETFGRELPDETTTLSTLLHILPLLWSQQDNEEVDLYLI